MKSALLISGSAHALVLGAVLFSFAAPSPLDAPALDVVPIAIVPVEDVSRAVQGDAEAPLAPKPAIKPTVRPPRAEPAQNVGDTDIDKPAPEAPKVEAPPKEIAAPPPPPPPAKPEPVKAKAKPEPAPEPEPKKLSLLDRTFVPTARPAPPEAKPQPKPEPEPKKVEAKPDDSAKKAEAEKRKAEAKKVADAKAKAKADAEAKAKADQIKALLDKQKAAAGGAKRSETAAARGTKKGKAAKLSRSETDALLAQLGGCFSVAAVGGIDPSSLQARVEFELKPDGTLDGRPRIVSSAGPDPRSQKSFARAALRAVKKCGRSGFDMPSEKYERWREVGINFSLADML